MGIRLPRGHDHTVLIRRRPGHARIYGWFNKNSGGSARAVGLKVANPFGLFDMHGNV